MQEMKKILTLGKLNDKITHYIMLQNGLSSRLADIDETIEQSYKLDQIPKDTSKLSDEKLISYIEKREKILDEISLCKKNINKFERIKNNILVSFGNLPDCDLKKMIKMHFFDEKKYSCIADCLGYTPCTIGYKLRGFFKYCTELEDKIFLDS